MAIESDPSVRRAALLKPRSAVDRALEQAVTAPGPVILADVQDDAGAGADSNTTGLLHALLARRVRACVSRSLDGTSGPDAGVGDGRA